MKHKKKGRTLDRDKDQHTALMRSLARSLILYEKMKTTEAKAKEVRPFIEKLTSRAKTNSLASRRILISRLGDVKATNKLLSEIAPRYEKRPGGYTRIIKMSPRRGDRAKMATIEFV